MSVPGDLSGIRVEKLLIAGLRGFCAGVVRAIDVVEKALEAIDGPVYVRKEIIHNRYVVDELRDKGARFVEEVDEVPDNASLIFSAHGIAPQVRSLAQQKKLQTIDATCPLVTKVHLEAIHYAKQGYTIILVGHHDHDETVGTLGEAPDAIRLVETREDAEKVTVPDPDRVAYLTQTTLSIDDTRDILAVLKRRVPEPEGARRSRTSATRRRTARTPSRRWRRTSTCCWCSGRPTPPTRSGCARSRAPTASRRT